MGSDVKDMSMIDMMIPPIGLISLLIDESIRLSSLSPIERMWDDLHFIERHMNHLSFIINPVMP